MKPEIVKPEEIEKRSFEILASELMEAGIRLDERYASVIKRCIHTSADFEYAATLTFSEDAVEEMRQLIRSGADIVTDTAMAMAGINKKKLASYGGRVHCFMADEDVAMEAGQRGVTRAAVSMERAAKLEKDIVFAIGNAPTALIRLHEMMEEDIFTPRFVIGVPVTGFTGSAIKPSIAIVGTSAFVINVSSTV